MVSVDKIVQDEKKIEALKGFITSSLLHYKKTIENPQGNCLPPNPEEAREAYENDPLIHRWVNVMVLGIHEILARIG